MRLQTLPSAGPVAQHQATQQAQPKATVPPIAVGKLSLHGLPTSEPQHTDSNSTTAQTQPTPSEDEEMGAGAGSLRKSGMHSARGKEVAPLAPAVATEAASRQLESEINGFVSNLMQWSEVHPLVLMIANVRHSNTRRNPLQEPLPFREAVSEKPPPDVLCLQEVLAGSNLITELGYRCVITSSSKSAALKDMAYGQMADEVFKDQAIVNEIYINTEKADWEVVETGIERISSPDVHVTPLNAAKKPLAVRTVAWAKLRSHGQSSGPFAWVFNVQLTGGLIEDTFFVMQLTDERKKQMERLVRLFESKAEIGDVGIIIGDAGIGRPGEVGELIREYFWSQVSPADQVRADAVEACLASEELETRFKTYLLGPSQVLQAHGWHIVHGQGGVPGKLGHTSNFIAVNHKVTTQPHEFAADDLVFAAGGAEDAASKTSAVATKAAMAIPAVDGADGHFLKLPSGNHPEWWGKPDGVLQQELRELLKERTAQEELAEEMQSRLTTDLRRLRAQCDAQGDQINNLYKALTDAKSAITQQIQETSSKRAVLSSEIEREKAQRSMLEAALNDESSEAEGRLRLAEQQLATAQAGRSSLEAQVRTAMQVRQELESHIEAEREGRLELETAGRRELERWSERNGQLLNNDAESEAAQIQRETARHMEEELELAGKLDEIRSSKSELQSKLEAETAAWNYEVYVIRKQLQQCDEECRAEEEVVQALQKEEDTSASEQQELENQTEAARQTLAEVEDKLNAVQPQVNLLERQLRRSRVDDASSISGSTGGIEAMSKAKEKELREELAQLERQLSDVKQENGDLEAERAGTQGMFSCFRLPRKASQHTPTSSAAAASRTEPASPGSLRSPGMGTSPAAPAAPATIASPPVSLSASGSGLGTGASQYGSSSQFGTSQLGGSLGTTQQGTSLPGGSAPGTSQVGSLTTPQPAGSYRPRLGSAQHSAAGSVQPPSVAGSTQLSAAASAQLSGGAGSLAPHDEPASERSKSDRKTASVEGAGLGMGSDRGSDDGRGAVRDWM